ncbi:MAG: hypothetical protein H7831_08435 [Magnetococcus sp. WYHC-3]
MVINPNTTDVYLQIFDLASGSVTVGTTTPKQSYLVPAGDGTNSGAAELNFAEPLVCKDAVTIACTTAATTNGAPGSNSIVNILYS